MMKENEDGVVHLVVGRTHLRYARGAVFGGVKDKKNMEKEWCESDSGSGSGRGLHQFFGRKNKIKKKRK